MFRYAEKKSCRSYILFLLFTCIVFRGLEPEASLQQRNSICYSHGCIAEARRCMRHLQGIAHCAHVLPSSVCLLGTLCLLGRPKGKRVRLCHLAKAAFLPVEHQSLADIPSKGIQRAWR